MPPGREPQVPTITTWPGFSAGSNAITSGTRGERSSIVQQDGHAAAWARSSRRFCSGTRVPLNTTVPPRISGSE